MVRLELQQPLARNRKEMKCWLDFPPATIIFIFYFRNWSLIGGADRREWENLPASQVINFYPLCQLTTILVSLYTFLPSVVGEITTPQRWPHPALNLWMYYLTRQRDFTNVIKWRILRRGGYPRLFRRVQDNYKGPYKGRREARKSELQKEMWLMVT